MKARDRLKLLSIGVATAFVLLSGCAPMEGRETAGQYVDDATVSTKVRAALIKDQSLKAFDIHVETMQDVVQLSGFVDSSDQRTQAEQITRGINGVRGVRNDIVLRNS